MHRSRRKKEQTDRPPSRRAYLYARVSSREQEKEGYSIPAQLMLLRTYAIEHGLVVAEEFVDVESAKKSGRTGFSAMVKRLRADQEVDGHTRVVLVEKTDRLYRNFKDYVTLEELDLEIHLVKESTILSGDSRSAEKFMHGIKVLMAKNYLDNLSEEVKKGMIEKARQGGFPTKAPLGYLNARVSGRSQLVVDQHYAPLVRHLFESYAAGLIGIRRMGREVARFGLVHPKTGKPLHTSAVHRILTNPVYYGEFYWAGKSYRGEHEPIITRELWERVQQVLAAKNFKGPKHRKYDWAFQGLISCGHCGAAYTAEIKKGTYVYYHCTGAKGRCPEKYVREERLAEAFGRALGAISLDDEVLAWLVGALRSSHAEVARFRDEAMAKLQAEHQRLVTRLDTLYLDKLDGTISLDVYQRRSAEWNAQRERICRDIDAHGSASRTYLEEGAQLLELAQRAGKLYELQEMREKRRLLDFVFSNSTWKDGELQPVYRKPFDFLAVANVSARREKAGEGSETEVRKIWWTWLDVYRTALASPDPELRAVLEAAARFAA